MVSVNFTFLRYKEEYIQEKSMMEKCTVFQVLSICC